jgi:type I restriction enzyme, S subunit
VLRSVGTVGDFVLADEPGFACSKTKLVESGLVHLRPFNIGLDGGLSLVELYRVPPGEAPSGRNRLEPGDILFNNTNSAELVGKSALVTQQINAGFSNHLNRIRVDRSKVDPRWFAMWLRHKRESGLFTRNATRWVSQAAYKTSQLRSLPIRLPALEEQSRVADLLSAAENIGRMRREAEQKAMEIIPALFLDMFGDPATNPKGWETKSISEYASIIVPTRDKPKSFSGDIPWITIPDLRFPYTATASNLLSHLEANQVGNRLMPAGSVLLSCAASLGKVSVTTVPAYANQQLYGLVPRAELITPEFLASSLLLRGEAFYTSIAGTSTLGFFSKAKALSIQTFFPPIQVQRVFSAHVRALSHLQATQHMAAKQSQAAFQSLLAGVFGEGGNSY